MALHVLGPSYVQLDLFLFSCTMVQICCFIFSSLNLPCWLYIQECVNSLHPLIWVTSIHLSHVSLLLFLSAFFTSQSYLRFPSNVFLQYLISTSIKLYCNWLVIYPLRTRTILLSTHPQPFGNSQIFGRVLHILFQLKYTLRWSHKRILLSYEWPLCKLTWDIECRLKHSFTIKPNPILSSLIYLRHSKDAILVFVF